MHKLKHLSQGKFYIGTIIFLGLLVLGVGFSGWALINISSQSVDIADIDASITASPITYEVKQVSLVQEDTAPTQPEHQSVIPVPDKILYPIYPSEGDNIGSLSIPVLDLKLPIIQGTGADELKKGVGHFIQSVLPGEEDNCILSGHRDTVFAELGKLKIGDQLIVQTSAGIFIYEIKHFRIVDKDDKTVIVPTEHAVLTMSTCYPFHFVGSAPDRYIIIADLVNQSNQTDTIKYFMN